VSYERPNKQLAFAPFYVRLANSAAVCSRLIHCVGLHEDTYIEARN
jgi:hypothetical protein